MDEKLFHEAVGNIEVDAMKYGCEIHYNDGAYSIDKTNKRNMEVFALLLDKYSIQDELYMTDSLLRGEIVEGHSLAMNKDNIDLMENKKMELIDSLKSNSIELDKFRK